MRGEKARRPLGQLGQVIPVLLAAVCLVDIALRFMSIDPLAFRAWEAMTRYRPPGAAFEPNRHYYSERTYGDAAAMGNLPGLRQYRRQIFTTDALGFRNVPQLQKAGVAAIMIGDSNAAGSGVDDDQTLPARLSELAGCGVYNAGSEDAKPHPDQVLDLSHKLHVRGGVVIHLYSEVRELPTIPPVWKLRMNQIVAETPGWVGSVVARIRGIVTVSPLRILSERAMKTLEDDRILPNSYAGNVVRATLHNGDSMLFPAQHVNEFYSHRPVAVEYWTWLRDDLRREGLDLLVLLVPGKYTVYRPFLVDQGPAGPGTGHYLDRLESELRAEGISVLNLTPFLSAEVARALERHEYLYWLDDIHWNARGVALTAAAIRARWPLLEASCSMSRSRVVQKP